MNRELGPGHMPTAISGSDHIQNELVPGTGRRMPGVLHAFNAVLLAGLEVTGRTPFDAFDYINPRRDATITELDRLRFRNNLSYPVLISAGVRNKLN